MKTFKILSKLKNAINQEMTKKMRIEINKKVEL
jgi:hypothetical protein